VDLQAIRDNAGAVHKRWIQNNLSLDDAISEAANINSGCGFGEGWNDLGLDTPAATVELSVSETDVCDKVFCYL
jgi:hypothetical protein